MKAAQNGFFVFFCKIFWNPLVSCHSPKACRLALLGTVGVNISLNGVTVSANGLNPVTSELCMNWNRLQPSATI